ncbi:MAG: hypothetical protein U0X76_06610 [Bacteroidia bacterium]
MKQLYFLLSFLLFAGTALAGDLFTVHSSFEKTDSTQRWINLHTIIPGADSSFYSHTDSLAPYGIGYESAFPEQCSNRNIILRIKGKFRCAALSASSSIVFSVSKGGKDAFWDGHKIKFTQANHWLEVSDSIRIPSNLTTGNCTFKIYVWNQNGEATDADDISISASEIILPSYFPVIDEPFKLKDKSISLVAENSEVKIFSQGNTSFFVTSSDQSDTLLSHPVILAEEEGSKPGKVKKIVISTFRINKRADGCDLFFESKEFSGSIKIDLVPGNQRIRITSALSFLKEITVRRIALVFDQTLPLKEVFTSDGLISDNYFSKEYWLGRNGFSLQSGKKKYIFEKPEHACSVQLNDYGKKVCYNFDYCADHPLLHFPEMKVSKGIYKDASCRTYAINESLILDFEIAVVPANQPSIGVMNNPDGFQSCFVWTEHADYADLRTHKAVAFGSENINSPDSASQGFTGHKIPVTKSVFYANPENQKLALKDGRFSGESANILSTKGFDRFLKQLSASGFEICLHTPDPFTTNLLRLDSSLSYMQAAFNSPTWIDHGYDNSPQSNREDLACDGLNSNGKNFSLPSWKKYGVKYFWNSFYEDSNAFGNYSFNSFLSAPYAGWGHSFPAPEYWITKSGSDTIYSWKTGYTLDPPDGNMWSYYLSDARLEDLAESFSDCILHCYSSRVDSTNGFYSYNGNEIVVNPEFDKALAKIAEYRNKGLLWVTTIKDMMNYRLLLENVSVTYSGKSIRVLNRNGEAVNGLTLFSKATLVFPEQVGVRVKTTEKGNLFILNLAPHQQIEIPIQ